MKRYLAYSMAAVCLFFVGKAYVDNISFSWTPGNTDTLNVPRYKADRNAIANWSKGHITNNNLGSDAAIAQSKIDSTTGWITNTAGLFTSTAGLFKNLRSPWGMRFFINDSTTFDKEFLFVSDSTDTIAIISNDSLLIKKKTHIDGGLHVDSLQIGNGTWITTAKAGGFAAVLNDGAGNIWSDSIFYYVFNDNVSLSFRNLAGVDTVLADNGTFVGDTLTVTALPTALIPATSKTVYLPIEFSTNPNFLHNDAFSMSFYSFYEIPNTAITGKIIRVNSFTGNNGGGAAELTFKDGRISYSLN